MYSDKSTRQSRRPEMAKAAGHFVLRDAGPYDLLFHSTQGPQSSWRYDELPSTLKTSSLRTIAYTTYAFFEWSLILLDVGFDAVTALDFEGFELVVKDVQGASTGYVYWLPKYSNVGSRPF